MKLKKVGWSLAIFLGALICILNVLDAPAYVRCTKIGVDEFLEVGGDVSETQKSEILVWAMNKILREVMSLHFAVLSMHSSKPFYFPVWLLKNVTAYGETSSKNFTLSNQIHISGLNPEQGLLCSPLELTTKIFIKPASPSGGSSLPSETLQLIITSIIRS